MRVAVQLPSPGRACRLHREEARSVGVGRVIGLLCVNMSVKKGKRKERERERKVGKGLADISKAAAAAATAAAPRAAIRADIDRRNNNGGANAMLAVN